MIDTREFLSLELDEAMRRLRFADVAFSVKSIYGKFGKDKSRTQDRIIRIKKTGEGYELLYSSFRCLDYNGDIVNG